MNLGPKFLIGLYRELPNADPRFMCFNQGKAAILTYENLALVLFVLAGVHHLWQPSKSRSVKASAAGKFRICTLYQNTRCQARNVHRLCNTYQRLCCAVARLTGFLYLRDQAMEFI